MKLLAYVHLRNIHNSTGAGRVARNIVEQLDSIGQDEIRILSDRHDSWVLPLVGAPWTDFQYKQFPMGTSRQQAMWLLTNAPKAERWWPDADLVYCTGESYVPTRRMKSAVTLHDAAFFEAGAHAGNFANLKQRAKWQILHRRLARRVDMFHTVSQFSADRLSHFFPEMKNRLRVVHNGATDLFFAPPDMAGQEALAALGLVGRRFVLVPRGLAYRKNADLILAAWPKILSQHPDLMLVISSHNDPIYAERARRLGPSVQLTGFVADTVLRSLYHAADIVWYPSLYEGFGIPLVEAMACGTAIVASDSSSIPEVAGDSALLVDPLTIDHHVDAIDYLLVNDAERAALVDRGRERSRRFTWRLAAERLRSHFADLG